LTGKGAGIVVRVTNDGAQSVVSTSNPTHVFEALVIYCAGLGDVDPRQIAGQQASFSPLSQTIDTVKVTIGGLDAPVVFAGLTPGFTGPCQVNSYVPVGVAPGDNVPLIITQAGAHQSTCLDFRTVTLTLLILGALMSPLPLIGIGKDAAGMAESMRRPRSSASFP